MIIEAIDKRTKMTAKINDVRPGQRVICPYCGVDMHPVLGVPTPFFRCYEGGKHSHYLCEQLEKSNRVYDPNLIDIEQLFNNLFRPVDEHTPPVKPRVIPPILPPEDIPPDEGSGAAGIEPGEEDEGHGGEDDDSNDDNLPAPVILPCRTLSQLLRAGIQKLGPSERIGSHLRSDIFLWYRDFDKFFVNGLSLGERVLAVKPCWPVNKQNAIVFASFSGIYKTDMYKTKCFILTFPDRKEYNKACKKLFNRITDSTGANRTEPKYNMVLIAGDWTELAQTECSKYSVKRVGNAYGAQISDFYSKNQIYPIPQQKRKEK